MTAGTTDGSVTETVDIGTSATVSSSDLDFNCTVDFELGRGASELAKAATSPSHCQPDEWQSAFIARGRDVADKVSFRTPRTLSELLEKASPDRYERCVCVITDITSNAIATLGRAWRIDPAFFAEYAANPTVDELWSNVPWDFPEEEASRQGESVCRGRHLKGVYEYPSDGKVGNLHIPVRGLQNGDTRIERELYVTKPYPIASNTKVSYIRLSRSFYLFLVDSPLILRRRTSHHMLEQVLHLHPCKLRFPYAANHGGILLPIMRQHGVHSPAGILRMALTDVWQFNLLFQHSDYGYPEIPLLYLLANSAWQHNVRDMEESLKKISFRELRNPQLDVTDKLHTLREDLLDSRAHIRETNSHVYDSVRLFFAENKILGNLDAAISSPLERLVLREQETQRLNAFLLETFQLLMNTLAVRDSQLSLQQMRSGLTLTGLAAIYLPLSLAVSIFGMNLNELNSTGQPLVVFMFTALIISALTAIGLYTYMIW